MSWFLLLARHDITSSCQSDCRSRITDNNKNRNRAQVLVTLRINWCTHLQNATPRVSRGHYNGVVTHSSNTLHASLVTTATRGCWLGRKTLFIYNGTVQSVIWSALKVTLYWHWYNTATAISNTAIAGYNESRFSDLRHSATLRIGTSWFK